MGHPPRAVWLPTSGYDVLADEVADVAAWHGAPSAALADLLRLRDGSPRAQLAAIAWVLDPARTHVLLVRHRTFGWSCPGGHVEVGEHPAAAAARELGEETGLRLDPDDGHPCTVTHAGAPATADGPAHDHWLVGYRFTAERDAPLRPERDPVGWHHVDALPGPRPDDLAALLERVVASARRHDAPRPG